MGNPYNTAEPIFGLNQQQVNRIDAGLDAIEKLVQNPAPNPPTRNAQKQIAIVKGKLATALTVDSSISLSLQTATMTYWCPSDPTSNTSAEAAVSDFQTLTVYPWGFPNLSYLPVGTPVTALFANGRWYVVPPNWGQIVVPTANIAAIAAGVPASGSAELYTFSGGGLVDYGKTITVYNLSNSVANAGQFYQVEFNQGAAFIVGTQQVNMFEATANADFTADSLTADVNPSVAIWGPLPNPDLYPMTANNDFALSGTSGQNCLCVISDVGTLYLIQIQPPIVVEFYGTLYTTLLTTDTTADVTPTTAIWGTLPTDTTITAANDFQTSGSTGQLVLIQQDNDGNYHLIPTTSQPLPILFWTTLTANCLATDATASCAAGVTQIFGTKAAAAFTANNNQNLAGQNGTVVLIAGDNTIVDGSPAPNYYLLSVLGSVMFWGNAGADFAATDTTFSVNPTTLGIYGKPPVGAITCNNKLTFAGKSGDQLLVVQRESTGSYDVIAQAPVIPVLFWGQLQSTLASSDATGTATGTTKIFGALPSGTITFNNTLSLTAPNLSVGLIAADNAATPNYYLIRTMPSVEFLGTISTTLASTDTSITVSGSQQLFGPLPSSISCANDLGLSGKSGDKFFCVASEADGSGHLIAAKPTGVGGCKFTLTGAFSAGSASATVTTVWGTIPNVATDSITVKDLAGLYGPSASGAVGECIYDAVGSRYVVLSCQTKAKWVRGTLTSNKVYTTSSISVTVVESWDGVSPGSTVTVYDEDQQFSAASGTPFRACYKLESDEYSFVWMGC